MEVCTVCNRKFVQKRYLDQHMKIHQKHKPFQCSVCPKRFLRKQDKNRHERVHTVMAPGQRKITWAPRSAAAVAPEGPSVPGPSTAQPQPTGGAIGPLRKRRNQEPVASAASSSSSAATASISGSSLPEAAETAAVGTLWMAFSLA